MAYDESKLDELSDKLGMIRSFCDSNTGIIYTADKKSKQTICKALGYLADTNEAMTESLSRLDEERFLTAVAPSIVATESELQPLVFEMSLESEYDDTEIRYQIKTENNERINGHFWFHDMPLIEEKTIHEINYKRRRVYLFMAVPIGYHQISFVVAPQKTVQAFLIITPDSCYMPPFTAQEKRVFGFPLQLYALKSATNWGIGDFGDLAKMIGIAGRLGASLVGVNPLNALFPDTPQDASPYCASSRLFLNPLYVDMECIPEAKTSRKFQAFKQTPSFQNELKEARENNLVQYETVAKLKYESFKVLHEEFLLTNFDKNGNPITYRAKKFEAFKNLKGEDLTLFATYHLLRKQFLTQGKSAIWQEWDSVFQDKNSEAVRAFQQSHQTEISEIEYQQFVAFEQYERVIKAFQTADMPLGLYTDLPVGVGSNSAEVWSNRSVFMPLVTTGAPPDMFNKKGQDWSLSPFNPKQCAKEGFLSYRKVIASAMHGAGAVRLDHAFGLERLYLRVKGATGAYLKYPYKAMMGIVALESHRNKCMVIAEDLGTAPEGFHEKMYHAKALSFKIAHYLQENGVLLSPEKYPYLSLMATGTHDLPSYSAFWKGLDLELGYRMKTITKAQYQAHVENRKNERKTFVETFYQNNLPMPERSMLNNDTKTVPDWFIPNTYAFLARTKCLLLLVRFEDLLEQDEQINLPGTYLEYPNWRYKLPLPIEALEQNKNVKTICRLIAKERCFAEDEKGENKNGKV